MYANRPIIKLQLEPIDKWLEVLAASALIMLWIFSCISYTVLPQIIPVHFNFKGVIDGYGSKYTVLILPLIVNGIYLLLSGLNKYPQIFNYTVTITERNAKSQYQIATRLFRVIKLIIVILFIGIAVVIVASIKNSSVSRWIASSVPIIPVVFIVLTMIYPFNTIKNKQRQ